MILVARDWVQSSDSLEFCVLAPVWSSQSFQIVTVAYAIYHALTFVAAADVIDLCGHGNEPLTHVLLRLFITR